jgi:alpha-N-dichloroacetyl-p-aminophenylserinol N-oxygenase
MTHAAAAAAESLGECHRLLSLITQGWGRRAQVKTSALEDELCFDPRRDDFLESLLPFQDHSHYRGAPPQLRALVLTCGWLIYNQKTICIETDLITPACNAMLMGLFSSVSRDVDRLALSETLVDEAYHVLLAVKVSQLTRQYRDSPVPSSEFRLVQRLGARQEGCDARERALCQVAVAVVSELFISDYLAQLGSSAHIQPVHRLCVASHRKDELAHSQIFRSFAPRIVDELTGSDLDLFAMTIADAALWFADPELGIWAGMLEAIGFPHWREMLKDCDHQHRTLAPGDFLPVVEMAEQTGLTRCVAFQERLQLHRLQGALGDRPNHSGSNSS